MLFRQLHGKVDLIIGLLEILIEQGSKIMSAQDDFNTAMDKLGASIDVLGTEIAAMVAAHNTGNDAAFQAATTRVLALQGENRCGRDCGCRPACCAGALIRA